jgi:hypothetical protein
MRGLKEAVAKIATQARCESLVGLYGWARYLGLPKPDILSVICMGIGDGWAMTQILTLPGEEPSYPGRCNYDSGP